MANDRIIKPRKGTGWNEVVGEAPATAPAPTTGIPERFGESSAPSAVAGTSISVSRQELVTIHDAVLGGSKWREINEGLVAPSEDEEQRLLEEVLGDAPANLENVRALYDALRTKDSLGWDRKDFPVFHVAADFLGLSKAVKAEEDQFRTALFAELSARGA